jgi:hypothetical protein
MLHKFRIALAVTLLALVSLSAVDRASAQNERQAGLEPSSFEWGP